MYIGDHLTADHGKILWDNWLYLNHWWRQGQLFSYSGPPDHSINIGNTTITEGMFMPIMWSPPNIDSSERQLGMRCLWWHEYADANATVNIYDGVPYSGDASGTRLLLVPAFGGTRDAAYGDQVVEDGSFTEIYKSMTFTPDANGDFCVIGVEVKNLMPAALNIWEMPPAKFNTTNTRSDEMYFSPGEPIRGYTSGTDATGSLGHLRHWIGSGADGNYAQGVVDGDWDKDWIERGTRRCYFQYGHHNGIWSDSTSSYNLFRGHNGANEDFTFRIKARNLLGATSGALKALPAIVVSQPSDADNMSTGCTVTFTSARTSDTWTYTFTGSEAVTDAASPAARCTLVKPNNAAASAIDLDVFNFATDEYDFITVSVQCATGKECVIHTVSLWEYPQW